jgi:hypothetical protein
VARAEGEVEADEEPGVGHRGAAHLAREGAGQGVRLLLQVRAARHPREAQEVEQRHRVGRWHGAVVDFLLADEERLAVVRREE